MSGLSRLRALLAMAAMLVAPFVADPAQALVVHQAIYITSNSAFTRDDGVTCGSGRRRRWAVRG